MKQKTANNESRTALYIKVIASVMILVAPLLPAKAGNGDNHAGVQVGVLFPGMANATISFDTETSYHNAWEVYLDAFTMPKKCPDCAKVCSESFWKSSYGLSVGGAYKPAVHRSRNSVGRVRIGADVGTNNREFALGIELGYEYVWTFRNGCQFVLQQKNEVCFWGKETWRFGGLVGFRIPLP